MDVALMMMMDDDGCRIDAMAPGDELHVAGSTAVLVRCGARCQGRADDFFFGKQFH
jgi:hypothetical protein